MRGKSWFIVLLGLVGVFLGVQASFGAGFALYEGSARGNALGGSVIGRADDPSALFYNPAGITQLEGTQVMAGATFIMPTTDVTTRIPGTDLRVTTSTEDNLWIPPHLYTTYQFSNTVWFGLGVFSQFGLGTEFPEDWPGRFNSYKAVIETVTINPNIALKLNDKLSIAGGLDFMYFDLDLRNKINTTPFGGTEEVDQTLTGNTWGYGVNFALHYKACDWLRLGASYRSQVKQKLTGRAEFRPEGQVGPVLNFEDTDAHGNIILPDEVYLGAAFYPTDRFSIEVSTVWTHWSTYDELTIQYDRPLGGVLPSVSRIKDWDDVWRFQLGGEYKVNNWLDLRLSYVYDPEPIPEEHADYLVPANNRNIFGGGTGFHWRNWSADISYNYILIEDRNVDERLAEGILESDFENGHAHLVGVSIGYKF